MTILYDRGHHDIDYESLLLAVNLCFIDVATL